MRFTLAIIRGLALFILTAALYTEHVQAGHNKEKVMKEHDNKKEKIRKKERNSKKEKHNKSEDGSKKVKHRKKESGNKKKKHNENEERNKKESKDKKASSGKEDGKNSVMPITQNVPVQYPLLSPRLGPRRITNRY